jgi:hypothetical protein
MNNFTVISYVLEQELVEIGGESVGEIILKDELTGEIHTNTIWYDEDGNHYFCWGTGEYDDDNEIIEDDLLQYHTDYVNP